MHRNVYRQALMPGRGQRLQHLLEGRLHLGRTLGQAELAVAVVALKARRRAIATLRRQHIARCFPCAVGRVVGF